MIDAADAADAATPLRCRAAADAPRRYSLAPHTLCFIDAAMMPRRRRPPPLIIALPYAMSRR